ncbi:hypothetical protein I552_4998 [Mycobacterium xenopi 3993]|nr:hypothetical protein I552_4998 [Mycobacterium xenopi 3993]
MSLSSWISRRKRRIPARPESQTCAAAFASRVGAVTCRSGAVQRVVLDTCHVLAGRPDRGGAGLAGATVQPTGIKLDGERAATA